MADSFIRLYKVTPQLCDDLIEYHKNNTEYKYAGQTNIADKAVTDLNVKESLDAFYYNASNHPTIKKLFSELNAPLENYINHYSITPALHTEECGNIQHYKPGGGFKVWHTERTSIQSTRRQLVYMIYLNDVPNGGTEWKFLDVKTEAVKGDLVIWPSDFTHTHRGIVSKTHEKWIATGWFLITP